MTKGKGKGKKKPEGPEPKVGKLVVPSHGRGKLWVGRPANPKAGPGRPRSEIRRMLRGDLLEVREELLRLKDEKEPCPKCGRKFTDADLLRWLDFSAKYGLGTPKEGADETLLRQLAADVQSEVGDNEVMERIFSRWVDTIGRHVEGM